MRLLQSRTARLIFLIALLLLAFALRVYRLDGQPIWGDEAFGIQTARYPLARILMGGTDTHPPLYNILLHLWQQAAGPSIFSTRYLSLMWGMILVAAVYATGRSLASRPIALLAVGLAACGPFAVYYSQEIRTYSQVAATTTLSTWAFAHLLKGNRTRFWSVLYGLFSLLAMYSLYFSVFVMAAHTLYAIGHWRLQRHSLLIWLVAQIGLALAYLPWIAVQASYLSGKAMSHTTVWSATGTSDILSRTFQAFGAGTTLPVEVRPLGWLFLLIPLIGLIIQARRRPLQGNPCLIALCLFLPVALMLIAAPLWPFYNERFLIVTYPAFLIALAATLTTLWQSRLRWLMPVLLIGILALDMQSLGNYFYNPTYLKSGYRDLMEHIRQNARPGDGLVLLNPEQEALFSIYGLNDLPAYRFPIQWDDPANQTMLTAMSGQQRLWLVEFGNASDWDFGGHLAEWLKAHTFRAYRGGFMDGALSLYIVGQTSPDHPVDFRFGESIRLSAYGISSEVLSRGDVLQIALQWEGLAPMQTDYTIFTHIVDDQSHLWAQMDGPSSDPTHLWEVGHTSIDRFAITLAPDMPPGKYWIEVGWYDLASSTRLPAVDSAGKPLGDRVMLIRIEVR
jgi:hypothetical protein